MTGDQRVTRGMRSRSTITRRAVDVASIEGLSGLSFGSLAADVGLSKGGVAALFPTKEQLQVATVESAREVFLEAVVQPTSAVPSGAARLKALIERWIAYAEAPLFPGGCFWAANLPDFDSRPGPVRDSLARQRRSWLALLAEQVSQAIAAGEVTGLDPELTAFQIDALLNSANIAMRLGETGGADKVRRVIDGLLA
ncbi:TetR/AcrR family transcriptional regulator [Nonomuraea sp. NPDC050783]|uniref:TetR/AcrR family transcriptional regulator n=1 Tax=Nonomuraea sp. NPDC050783 TaxID=3154634 RepID=UPI003466A585